MPRVTLSLVEWQRVAQELASPQTAPIPPGLLERVQAMLQQAPTGWPEQPCAIELDESGAEAVRTVHAALIGYDRDAEQRAAGVSEAIRIIHDHQHRP
jgi:hypothetical protein